MASEQEIGLKLAERIKTAVEGLSERDAELAEYDDTLMGVGSSPTGTRLWRNSSSLVDPLTSEAHIGLMAALFQAASKEPITQVDSLDTANEDAATELEQTLFDELIKANVRARIYDQCYGVGRDTTSFLKICADKGKKWRGLQLSHVNAADLYVCPATAQDLQAAPGAAIRTWHTSHSLKQRVKTDKWNSASVESAIRNCGESNADAGEGYKRRQDDNDGIDSSASGDAIEIFEYWGVIDDEDEGDVYCVVSEAGDLLYKEKWNVPFLPIVTYNMLRRPGRLAGHSTASLLYGLQEEATANTRYTADSLAFTLTPAYSALTEDYESLSAFSIYPGAVLPKSIIGSIEPFPVAGNPNLGFSMTGFLQARAAQMTSAEGAISGLQNKVRKNGEVQAAQQAAGSKFDLYLAVFQDGMNQTALYASWYILNYRDGMTVTLADLEDTFRFTSVGTSQAATPEINAELKMKAWQAAQAYFGAMGTPLLQQNPQLLKYFWHAAKENLNALNVRNPESWIGKEPTGQPAGQVPMNPVQPTLQIQGGLNAGSA